jgi:hypothetical protein
MRYEIGYFIPVGVDRIEGWKEKLESEIRKPSKPLGPHS